MNARRMAALTIGILWTTAATLTGLILIGNWLLSGDDEYRSSGSIVGYVLIRFLTLTAVVAACEFLLLRKDISRTN